MDRKQKKYAIEAEVEIPCYKCEIRNVVLTEQAENFNDAVSEYKENLKKEGSFLVSFSKKASAVPAIIFLAIASLFTFVGYYENDGFNKIDLCPGMVSLLISIVIYSSFIIRIKGITNTFKNIPDLFVSVLFIYMLAVFINIFTGNGKVSSGIIGKFLEKLGFTKNYYLLIAGIVLSWLGMKQICGFIWIAIIFFGLAELSTCGEYMRNFIGTIFLLSSFLGFVFYLKYEGKKIVNSFKKLAETTASFVKSDVDESDKFARSKATRIIRKKHQKKQNPEYSIENQQKQIESENGTIEK